MKEIKGTVFNTKYHSIKYKVLSAIIWHLPFTTIQYLSELDLNRLSDHCAMLLKLSSFNPNSTHSLKIKMKLRMVH